MPRCELCSGPAPTASKTCSRRQGQHFGWRAFKLNRGLLISERVQLQCKEFLSAPRQPCLEYGVACHVDAEVLPHAAVAPSRQPLPQRAVRVHLQQQQLSPPLHCMAAFLQRSAGTLAADPKSHPRTLPSAAQHKLRPTSGTNIHCARTSATRYANSPEVSASRQSSPWRACMPSMASGVATTGTPAAMAWFTCSSGRGQQGMG